jgi:hypothetical protein
MSSSQNSQTTNHDENNAVLSSDCFSNGTFVVQDSDTMIDYSDWEIPDAMTFAIDERQLHRDGNHILRGTGSFDQTHVLPGYAGARLAEWNMSMAMSYTTGAMNKDGKNKQSTDTSCQYATSGGHSTHYHSPGNASENDIARNKNQEPQPYPEVDPDDRHSQVTIPTREKTTTTNLVRC